MRRLAVFAHCAIDTITIGGSSYDQIGGSACYCGITARRFKFDVDLFTRFGTDFPVQYLTQSGINPVGPVSERGTTRFAISVAGRDRTLRLEAQCEPIPHHEADADGHIVSPIFHEISGDVLGRIKRDSRFLLVDPQGFLRRSDGRGNVTLADTDIDLAGVDAVKASPEEAARIIGGGGGPAPSRDEMMVALQRKGAKYVLLTDGAEVSLLVKDKAYSITLPNRRVHDTTGIGDIFCAAFACTMLRENDFLWALCFAGGAAQAAIDSGEVGLQKIPGRGRVQTNASYFYNLVKFRGV